MPTDRMIYGDDEQVVRETFDDVEVEREDGWAVVFRGTDGSCACTRITCSRSIFSSKATESRRMLVIGARREPSCRMSKAAPCTTPTAT